MTTDSEAMAGIEDREMILPNTGLRVRAFCTPAEIEGFAFDAQFGTHAQYKSLYTKRESLEKNARTPGANVVIVLDKRNTIVGFGVLNHPEADERWAALGHGVMMEIKAIEVSRSRRSKGVAGAIMTMLLRHPRVEDMIVYMVGFSWTWDLDGSGMSAAAYRNMLINLFAPHGFQEFQTNEPNICLKPENLFMGRIGARVPENLQKAFKWIRFGVNPAV